MNRLFKRLSKGLSRFKICVAPSYWEYYKKWDTAP